MMRGTKNSRSAGSSGLTYSSLPRWSCQLANAMLLAVGNKPSPPTTAVASPISHAATSPALPMTAEMRTICVPSASAMRREVSSSS